MEEELEIKLNGNTFSQNMYLYLVLQTILILFNKYFNNTLYTPDIL